MCCNHFENWGNCLLLIFAPSHVLWGSGFIKSNTAVGRQIKKAPLLSQDLKHLILHGGSSVLSIKTLSTTCVDPVDWEDSHNDHVCLDPGSLDADALSQDRSDYMGKNLECCHCLWVGKTSQWFISSIYCQHQLIEHKKGNKNHPHMDPYTHPR